MSEVNSITRHEWKFVANASREDFELLVAAEEWKVLDNLAAKVRYYSEQFVPTDAQLDFLGLYDVLREHMGEHGTVPKWVVRLVNGKRPL